MMQIVLVASFIAAIVLIMCSAWLYSKAANWAILLLLGTSIALAILGKGIAQVQPLSAALALVVFTAFVYFLTVQSLMGRRVSEITSREDFRKEMESNGRFHGIVKVLYYLPIALMLIGISLGVIGKLSE